MESHAVPVLGMGENAPTARSHLGIAGHSSHNNLNAAAIARAVTVKLTQGPQSAEPAMTAIANSGKNDLPRTNPVCNKKAGDRGLMLCSFPLSYFCALCPK